MTMITKRLALAFSAAAGLLLAGAPANALSVTYSFTNTVGNVAGTVYGHIDGLVDNATSAATSVWVDNYPAGLGPYPAPFDVLQWSATVNENSFTVVGGVVTAAFFSIVNGNGNSDQLFLNSACACAFATGHTNFLDFGTNDTLYTWNVGNFGAADGLLIPGLAVPEPATWALMIGGFGMTGFAMRRRKVALAA